MLHQHQQRQQSSNFAGRDLVLKIAANTGALGAASALSVKELNVVVNKNTEHDFILGTLEPEDTLNKQITIEGSFTLNYEDRTIRDYMLDGTIRALSIKLLQTRDAAGDQDPEFYLELPTVSFQEWEAERGDNDALLTQTINFTALYDIANSVLISDCYVVNDVASY